MSMFYVIKDDKINSFADSREALEYTGLEIFETDQKIVYGSDGKLYFEGDEPGLDLDKILQQYTDAIQKYLDDFARTRNYDNILSATTYATSTVPKFRVEGQYAIEARDITWTKGYEILDMIISGKKSISTLEEILTELPHLSWPK